MIIKNVNTNKILTELHEVGIQITFNTSDLQFDENGKPLSHIANLTVVFTDGTDMDLVQSIIDAHDPTPIPPPPTKQEIFEQQITANTDYLLDVDFRLMLVELGMF